MKNRKAFLGIIGFTVILLTAAVPSPSQSCSLCDAQRNAATAVEMDRVFLELKYRDGFPGHRQYKRAQVKKLQCMLNSLGYCSGPIDGWYGYSTAKGVRCFLRGSRQEAGYGHTISWRQWLELERRAGAQCSKYNIF
ncbi:MAG: peptidoglycan-binding protein [Candidatus Electrothrix sp. AR4]|nr:peptidoglycan-binding protein [Candidatus Electrothrix sp. AR4]